MVELLVVLAIMMVVSVLGYPLLQNAIDGAKLRAITQETAVLARAARLEAIKYNACGVVRLDTAVNEVVSFVDQGCTGTPGKIIGRVELPFGITGSETFEGPEEDLVFQGDGRAKIKIRNDDDDPKPGFLFVNRKGAQLKVEVETMGRISVL
jgi:type II secretory pathway pseudopilin PulG